MSQLINTEEISLEENTLQQTEQESEETPTNVKSIWETIIEQADWDLTTH